MGVDMKKEAIFVWFCEINMANTGKMA